MFEPSSRISLPASEYGYRGILTGGLILLFEGRILCVIEPSH
jgi:hypothetical protein